MKNLNPYPEEKYSLKFKKTDLYKKLTEDFNEVTLKKSYWSTLINLDTYKTNFYKTIIQKEFTPRQLIGSEQKFSATLFYYLEFLIEKNPEKIYDLGCGCNIFKKYIPNIIGIGAEDPNGQRFYGDIHDYVDEEFIQGHKDYFESVFSICALHFRPLTEFSKVVNEFYSMIKPGGRGFLSINLKRMIEKSENFMKNTSVKEYDAYCREQLDTLTHIKFLVVDIDLEFLDEAMDGNIRLVMEK
jgi:hypothetical protein